MGTGTIGARPDVHARSSAADRSTAHALVVALLATAGIAVTYWLAVVMPAGQVIDTWVMTTTAGVLGEPAWARALLELVSASSVLVAAAAVAAIALLRGRPVQAACAFGVATVTPVAATVLKPMLDRPSYGLGDLANSLPSGHVAAVAGIVAAAWLVSGPAWRAAVGVVGTGAVAATGLATIALQWHRPSDVVAAAALAVAVGAVAALVEDSAAAAKTLAR